MQALGDQLRDLARALQPVGPAVREHDAHAVGGGPVEPEPLPDQERGVGVVGRERVHELARVIRLCSARPVVAVALRATRALPIEKRLQEK